MTDEGHRRRGLPRAPTRLIGRDAELSVLAAMLLEEDTRLVTVTGPGGCGKTRLALAVASAQTTKFTDGAALVELAALRDASMLIPAIADALHVQDIGARPLMEVVAAQLVHRELLLVLDNFEHILSAVPAVAALLEMCPRVTVLATSREPLHLTCEKRFPLAPLVLASPEEARDPERLAEVPACRLFIERARAVKPDFRLSATNCAAIAETCARLDGLPLAIELAAARSSILSPRALLERLQRRLDLRSVEADRPERHRGLREMLEWSYTLLSVPEQQLLRRLGVFAGPASLGAIAAICWDEPDDTQLLDLLAALVDKGLLQTRDLDDAEPRFEMLEIVREYAWEQLQFTAELGETRRRHALFYASVVRRMETDWWSPQMLASADFLERELPNLRAALAWSLDRGGDAAAGLNILSLPYFWDLRGHLGEARDWLVRLLNTPGAAQPTPERARGLASAAYLALMCGDLDTTATLVQEAVPLARSTGDPGTIWLAVSALGQLLRHRAAAAAAGEPYLREAYAVAQASGYRAGLIGSPFMIGDCRRVAGDVDGARRLFEECLEAGRALQVPFGDSWAERGLGHLDWMARDYARADAHLGRALRIDAAMGWARATADVLEALAWNAASAGLVDRAARLLGAAERARDSIGIGIQAGHLAAHEHAVGATRARLGEVAYDMLFRYGYTSTGDGVVDWATEPPERHRAGGTLAPQLTTREREVARLLAQGYTNREIAHALVIAERTAETHVTNILTKLRLTSRVQVQAWAATQGLTAAADD